ncbi:ankyrin repeat and protein kinase domain-containing protein [Legionella lytica]|uniref:Ankyrin repeat and protein kinase domain-containing protein n=1 Tax=Legionella lytica TaxID=96232 RepID=A0ABW8DAS8_9GAMM
MFDKQHKAANSTEINPYELSAEDVEAIFQGMEGGDLQLLTPYTHDSKYKLILVHSAVMTGQLEILQWLFAEKIADNASLTVTVEGPSPGLKEMNAILVAGMYGHLHILKWLHARLGSQFLATQRISQQRYDLVLLAAIYGHLPVFKWLIAQDYSLDVRDYWGNSPLLCAAINGKVSIVKWMVEILKMPLDVKNNEGDGIINLAAANGQLEVLYYVYGKKPNVLNELSVKGLTPAMSAAKYNKLLVLQWLCEKQGLLPLVEQRAKDGTTVFTAALSYGSLEVFQWLVSQLYGDRESPYLYEFLHLAAKRGQLEIVKWLITTRKLALDEKTMIEARRSMNGALTGWLERYLQNRLYTLKLVPSITEILSIIEKGELGALKTMHAQYSLNKLEELHHIKIVQLVAAKGQLSLLQWLIDENIFSEFSLIEGQNAILLAAENGHVSIIDWAHQLLGRQVISAQDKNGYDAVLFAAAYGHLSLLKWFYEYQYSFAIRARSGLSPLSLAIKGNCYDAVVWLLNGPNSHQLTAACVDIQNPVLLAASYGHLNILQLLEQKGYSLHCEDENGDTVLHFAAMNGFVSIVYWLVYEKQFSFTEIKNKAGYSPAAYAVIMGRSFLLSELWNAGKLSMPAPVYAYDKGMFDLHDEVLDFIALLELFSQEQAYDFHNKKLLETKARIPFDPLFTLISFLHHHAAGVLSSENVWQLCLLSENNVKRISLIVTNLAKHNLLNQSALASALRRVQTKIFSLLEVGIAESLVSDDQLKAQITLTDAHSFWLHRDIQFFAQGGQGTIRQAYSSINDVEPAYCVKEIQSGIVADLKQAARREAKYHGLFSRYSRFFTEGHSSYVVSSWQPGRALRHVSREELSLLPFDTRLKCIITALSNLNQLHSRYRTYNDIKPHNFILDVSGQALRLIDFGSVLKHGSTKRTMYTERYRDPVHKTGFLNDTYGMGLIVAILFPDLFAANFVSDPSALLVNPKSVSPQHQAIIKLVYGLIDKDSEKRCTIADALNYSKCLMEKLPELDEASVEAIAISTIYRTNTILEDVLRDARISRS